MAARDQYGEIFFDERGRRLLLSRKNDQMLFDYYAGLERRRREKPALQPILELTNPLPKTSMSNSNEGPSKDAQPKAEAQPSQTPEQKPAPETTEKTVAFADTDEVKKLGAGGGQKQKEGYNKDKFKNINNTNDNNMSKEGGFWKGAFTALGLTVTAAAGAYGIEQAYKAGERSVGSYNEQDPKGSTNQETKAEGNTDNISSPISEPVILDNDNQIASTPEQQANTSPERQGSRTEFAPVVYEQNDPAKLLKIQVRDGLPAGSEVYLAVSHESSPASLDYCQDDKLCFFADKIRDSARDLTVKVHERSKESELQKEGKTLSSEEKQKIIDDVALQEFATVLITRRVNSDGTVSVPESVVVDGRDLLLTKSLATVAVLTVKGNDGEWFPVKLGDGEPPSNPIVIR